MVNLPNFDEHSTFFTLKSLDHLLVRHPIPPHQISSILFRGSYSFRNSNYNPDLQNTKNQNKNQISPLKKIKLNLNSISKMKFCIINHKKYIFLIFIIIITHSRSFSCYRISSKHCIYSKFVASFFHHHSFLALYS